METKKKKAQGMKFDNGKLRYDLLSPEAMEEWARAMTWGAQKYPAHDWRKGLMFNQAFASLQRHLWAWWNGEDLDQESNLNHLSLAMCQLSFLLAYVQKQWEHLDNRLSKKEKQNVISG